MSTLQPTTFASFSRLSAEIQQMIWSLAIQGRLVRFKPMWITVPDDRQELVYLVIAEPVPILQVCQQSRAVALKYYTKFECEQASRPEFENHENQNYEFCDNLETITPTYTYINWAIDVIFLECEDCSFDQSMNNLANRLGEAQHLLVDMGFCLDNGLIVRQIVRQIRRYFKKARNFIWVNPRDGFDNWDLGSLILQVCPTSKSDTFAAMCSQISTNSNIQMNKCPDGFIIAEAEVYTSKDIRYWPLYKRVSVS